MSQDDLNRFLLEDAIKDDLDVIARLLAIKDINSLQPASDLIVKIKQIDWPRIIFAGSILARATERNAEEAALSIATAALNISDHIAINDAGAILFDKLSNNRGVTLAMRKND